MREFPRYRREKFYIDFGESVRNSMVKENCILIIFIMTRSEKKKFIIRAEWREVFRSTKNNFCKQINFSAVDKVIFY